MPMQAGALTVNNDGTVTVTMSGMGVDLYVVREALANVPDPDNKKGCVTTAEAPPLATTLLVDSTAGYRVGDALGQYNYVGPLDPQTGQHEPATFKLTVGAIPNATTFTLAAVLPADVTVPTGTKFGFQGTAQEWYDQALPQVVKIRRQIAELAVADATTMIAYMVANMQLVNAKATISNVLGGLQTSTNSGDPTDPPALPQEIPVSGGVV